MFSLLAELHLWNSTDVEVSSNDFGAIRQNEKKPKNDSLLEEGKWSYCEKRRGHTSLSRKNTKFKELEECLQQNRIVYSKWQTNSIFQLVFSTGLIITVEIDTHTCVIERIVFDQFFVGKLESDIIHDVLILKSHILFALHDNMITLAHLSKPLKKREMPGKLSKSEVQIHTQELTGLLGKCKMNSNINGDLIAIWRMYNGDEVQPWTPSNRDQTHANIHIYTLTRTKLDLICLYRTEFDPICVTYSLLNTNILHSVEQKISGKGVVTIEICSYEVQKTQLSRTIVTSIPLQKQVCCHFFHSANRKLVLGCIDGSIVLFDQGKGTTLMVKMAFIPTMITLNHDGSVILAANEQSQLQFFDVALNNLSVQMVGNESSTISILDFSEYYKSRQTLTKLLWNLKPEHPPLNSKKFTETDTVILMLYERGIFAALKLVSNAGARSNVCELGYTPDVMIHQYLKMGQIDKAINVLLSLDWNFWGTICLISLNRIFNHLYRQKFTSEIEGQMQMALSSFWAPVKPHCQEVIEEYEGSVKSLSRRFFHLLLRHQLFEKAFCLAIDIGDHDLFMDMNYYAWTIKDYEMAIAAKNKAIELLKE